MRDSTPWLLAGTILAALVLSGCATPNDDVGGGVHAADWADPEAYKTGAFHGTVVSEDGDDGCRSCHGDDLAGNGRAPGCTACHSDPGGGHGSGWVPGSAHGAAAVADFVGCQMCHGADYRGGIAEISCYLCHDGPGLDHPSDAWLDPAADGFHGNDDADCARCHGEDGRGGSARVGCYDCHFGPDGSRVPPGSDWSHGSLVHGDLEADGAVCNACHRMTRDATAEPATCHDCHGDSGHPAGWATPDQHGAAAKSGFAACQACHGEDYRGGSADISCYLCHDGPGLDHPADGWLDAAADGFHGADGADCAECHGEDLRGGGTSTGCYDCHFNPDGSRVPAGSEWTHGTLPHGAFVPDRAVCDRCHAISRGFDRGPDSCGDCHTEGPTVHEIGRTWLDRASDGFHGTEVDRDGTGGCRACHGDDLAGGVTGVGCDDCHFGPDGSRVPDGSTWEHGAWPHSALEAYEATCNDCHELDRGYGHGPDGCHNCHEDEPAPHAVDGSYLSPAAPDGHGSDAAANLYACGSCHGTDDGAGNVRFDRGIRDSGCELCHNPRTAHPSRNGVDDYRWFDNAYTHRNADRAMTACTLCHGADLEGASGPACTGCHETSPVTSPSGCVSCHGAPPAGGAYPNRAGKHGEEDHRLECATCHDGAGFGTASHYDPPGPADIQPPEGEGISFDQSGDQVTCTGTCHGEGHDGESWY